MVDVKTYTDRREVTKAVTRREGLTREREGHLHTRTGDHKASKALKLSSCNTPSNPLSGVEGERNGGEGGNVGWWKCKRRIGGGMVEEW